MSMSSFRLWINYRMFTEAEPLEDVYDITIIGAGPVGMYALYYAGLRDVKAKILEGLDETGGGLKALYPEKYIYDVAGFPKILAKDLVRRFDEQARTYDGSIGLGQRVTDLKRRDDGIIEMTTSTGEQHFSKTVVICAGMGAFIPRKLSVPNLEELEGCGVYYFVKEPEKFKDKKVLIVGGGDSAVDHALLLEPLAKEINLIHRLDRFQAHEDSFLKLQDSSVNIYYPFWEIKTIHGEQWVERVEVVQTREGTEMSFDIDALVLNIGFLVNLKPLKEWGLELDKNSIKVDELMRTNIEGVFAAGDIVTHPGKIKLISTGTGEAAIAVNKAVNYIYPELSMKPGHSSHKKK